MELENSSIRWPVNPVYRAIAFRDVTRLIYSVANRNGRENCHSRALIILAKHITSDLVHYSELYWAQAYERSSGVSLLHPMEGPGLQEPYILRILRSGPKKRGNRVLRWLNWTFKLSYDAGIKRSISNHANPQDVYFTAIDESVLTYIKKRSIRRCYYTSPDQWLRRSDACDSVAIQSISYEIASGLSMIFSGIAGVNFDRSVLSYFNKWICEAVTLVTQYLNYDYTALPKKLFTGTGGKIWIQILKDVVFNHGGSVTTFSHGRPIMHKNIESMLLIDFANASRMILFYDFEINIVKNAVAARGLDIALPEIEARSADFPFDKWFAPPEIPAKPKVLVVGAPYVTCLDVSGGTLNSPVYLHWHGLLFKYLCDLGLSVTFKPYPSYEDHSASIASDYGIKIADQKYEDILPFFDLIVIDNFFSTTFWSSFESSKPAIFFDFGLVEFDSGILRALKKRFFWVDVRLNDGNIPSFPYSSLDRIFIHLKTSESSGA